jgi:hypothetical protein
MMIAKSIESARMKGKIALAASSSETPLMEDAVYKQNPIGGRLMPIAELANQLTISPASAFETETQVAA